MSFTADFELGTNGATIATADPGSLTAWSFIIIGSGNALTYDNSASVGGSQSAKFVNAGGVNVTYLAWSGSADTDYYGRFYLNAGWQTMALLNQHISVDINNAPCWTIALNDQGKLLVRDSATTLLYTFTTSINDGQWSRIEYHAVHSSGDLEVKLFNSPYGTSPTETSSIGTGQSLLASAVAVKYNHGGLNSTIYMDEIVGFADAYPGPFSAPSDTDIMLPQGRRGTGGSVYRPR